MITLIFCCCCKEAAYKELMSDLHIFKEPVSLNFG